VARCRWTSRQRSIRGRLVSPRFGKRPPRLPLEFVQLSGCDARRLSTGRSIRAWRTLCGRQMTRNVGRRRAPAIKPMWQGRRCPLALTGTSGVRGWESYWIPFPRNCNHGLRQLCHKPPTGPRSPVGGQRPGRRRRFLSRPCGPTIRLRSRRAGRRRCPPEWARGGSGRLRA
jgi:hypothetical protein